jgi:hypothetical protein
MRDIISERNEARKAVIISACTGHPLEDAGCTEALRKRLKLQGRDFCEVNGRYEEENEKAFLVLQGEGEDPFVFFQTFRNIGRQLGQQSVLELSEKVGDVRFAYLTIVDSEQFYVGASGVLRAVSETEAKRERAYTETPDGRFWVANLSIV